MEFNKELTKISGDSVLVEPITSQNPVVFKTVGCTTYVVRIHFSERSKMNVDDKLLRLMGEKIKQLDG